MSALPLSAGPAYARVLQDLNLGLPVIVRHHDTRALLCVPERMNAEALQALQGRSGTVFVGRYAPERGEYVAALPFSRDIDWSALLQAAVAGEDIPGAEAVDSPQLIAASDLLRRAELLPVGLWIDDADAFAGAPLSEVDVSDPADPRDTLSHATRLGAARLPLAGSPENTLYAYRNDADGIDHYALVIGSGKPLQPGVLTRLHSECFTGDFLGSLKCDCGPQLQTAVQRMIEAGQGILLYLRQEGRGIGLSNKIRAYALQDRGCDTVDANLHLGFGVEQRHFKIAALMLQDLQVESVTLLTNNPKKLHAIERYGIGVVGREALRVGENTFNRDYLAVKRDRTGHLLHGAAHSDT